MDASAPLFLVSPQLPPPHEAVLRIDHLAHALELAAKHSGARWRSPVDRVARVLVAFTDGLTLTWLVERDDDAARAVVAAAADALTRMAETP